MLGLFNFNHVRERVEPVCYNFSRENVSLAVVMATIEREAEYLGRGR